MPTARPQTRSRRSSSVVQYLARASTDPEHHVAHLGPARGDPDTMPDPVPPSALSAPSAPLRPRSVATKTTTPLQTFGPRWLQWVQNPRQSFILIVVALTGSLAFSLAFPDTPITDNPFTWFWYISHPIAPTHAGEDHTPRFKKGPRDVLYLFGWIVIFSCIRQSLRKPLFALGRKLGLKRMRKLERFMEQGYAFIYFTASSLCGLAVMSQQDSWFYQTKHFWLKYPHWDMTGPLKLAYWCQQALVMIAGLEKPRDDYVELILHHCITFWLVFASYIANLTHIGTAVFVSMDIPDAVFALSKCINYVGLEKTSNISFVIFMVTWGYFRHYQEFRILYSVLTEFDLAPAYTKRWAPLEGCWLPLWGRWQILWPLALLQLLMIFWSYLILRVLFRMLKGKPASDVREEGETENELDGDDIVPETKKASGVQTSKSDEKLKERR
ncbi:BZ3500_MvSof-1268-A1-R1_Chr8-2g10219 [Microbotryum saponariae]|uniref:BZ3500_MvSof-1268-A1-R1_Chr8-2g10219 protein n=1 Tax=Microbotryum saponariae TaxID=289078 RepID=A0A2X0NAM8_9BASI|nr:BZ3500_MvSof-1268-A1-R1_Chr8-2g10219 [Microbotryum saponariae]SDA02017.1 BZ3501_MvSof-1269-A2-R1_Chr8-2g09969 [Microbotryum saponariae]